MGQETADELNGRFTALQIAGETISANMLTTVAQMETIVATGISTNGAVVEIRNMMILKTSLNMPSSHTTSLGLKWMI